MEEADKKSESDVKVKKKCRCDREWKTLSNAVATIDLLLKRVRDLEEHLMSLDHGNEQGNNPDDGGWFD